MHIEYTKEAVKHIKELDRATKQRVKKAIEKLPRGDIKKLKGYKMEYRLRVGEYRIIFSSYPELIVIKGVLPRGGAYKRL